MDRIRYYFDEHVPKAIADGLRRRGIEVVTVQDLGREGMRDDEQLAFALQEGRVLVTMDDDFLALAAQGMPHAGIGYAQPHARSIGELLRALLLIHDILDPADMADHVEYL